MRSALAWLTVVGGLAMSGCTRVVDLDLEEGPKRLVVDARIELRPGDLTGRQVFRLSTTGPFGSFSAPPPGTGALVGVTDEDGGAWTFVETPGQAGEYAASGLIPAVGSRYRLTIDYRGDRYEASHRLMPVAPIDSLYFVYEEEGLAQGDSGFRAVIDYTDPEGLGNYYLWELVVEGELRIAADPGLRFRAISDDRFYDGGRVTGYQPYDEEVVDPGQSVAVRQIGLSESAFRYYFALFEQTTGSGGPFSVPPASVRGNVANLTAPDRYPLGFFLAAEVKERTAVVPPR
jgi:hypothetical protein